MDGEVDDILTSEQIEESINAGTFIFNGTEIIAVNQMRMVLNEDGTLAMHVYMEDAEEYEFKYMLYVEE